MFQPQLYPPNRFVNTTLNKNQFKNSSKTATTVQEYHNKNNFSSNEKCLQPQQIEKKVVYNSEAMEVEPMETSVSVSRPITKNRYSALPMNENQREYISVQSFTKNPSLRPVVSGNNNNKQNSNEKETNSNVSEAKPFGSTERDKMFVFTGTVERVLKWHKIFQNCSCIYEVIASVISIKNGTVAFQRTMLLRDRKGPILQVVYYSVGTHIDIEDFHIGQMLRCVGRMTGPNILTAITIRTATASEIDGLQRMCYVCEHAISHFSHS